MRARLQHTHLGGRAVRCPDPEGPFIVRDSLLFGYHKNSWEKNTYSASANTVGKPVSETSVPELATGKYVPSEHPLMNSIVDPMNPPAGFEDELGMYACLTEPNGLFSDYEYQQAGRPGDIPEGTMEVWFNSNGVNQVYHVPIAWGYYQRLYNWSGKLCWIFQSGGVWYASETVLTDTDWHCFQVRWDATKTEVWVDGVKATQYTVNGTGGTPIPGDMPAMPFRSVNLAWRLHSYHSSYPVYGPCPTASLDEARVYKRKLSDVEIAQNYAVGFARHP